MEIRLEGSLKIFLKKRKSKQAAGYLRDFSGEVGEVLDPKGIC